MQKPEPVIVLPLFQPERAALLDLLRGLDAAAWNAATVCPGWSVKDIAAHLLADDLGLLSSQRDGHSWLPPQFQDIDWDDWGELLEFINWQNNLWVEATRRLSPNILIGLLEHSGADIYTHFASLDPYEIGGPVNWAGPQPAPVWLDMGREYTERWLHQQQIRDAVGISGLKEPQQFGPVLETFVCAFPHTYRNVSVDVSTSVTLEIIGPAGSIWSIVFETDGWQLYRGGPASPTAQVTLDQESAWRLFTKGISPAEGRRNATISGDEDLCAPVFEIVSIIA
ncbi:MAG: maleylpyruvate isomerase family mycothiol-dependent enzyme [Anaerolineales bacterium]|nr:maleylpyruvate isomerase family mycothiol-dependent enzyme [Anaerolineales bacterium]